MPTNPSFPPSSGLSRRAFCLSAAAWAASHVAGAWANAPVYPSRRISLVVGFPAGGGVDSTARLMANELSASLKQPVVVENRGGAGGNVAAAAVARAPADGYTLLFTAHSGLIISKAADLPLPFDPLKDLAPVSFPAFAPVALVAHPKAPFNSFKEFVAHAKRHPGELNFALNGLGTSYHLALERIKADLDVDILGVPFQSGPQMMTALMSGEVNVMFASLTQCAAQVRQGSVKMIAMASNRRTPIFPEVPTVAESGLLPQYDQASRYGVFVPGGTPASIITQLHGEFARLVRTPAVAAAMEKDGITSPGDISPQKFGTLISQEVEDTRQLIRRAKLDLK